LFHAERQAQRQAGRRMDGQIDMTKLMLRFRSFANAPNNWEVGGPMKSEQHYDKNRKGLFGLVEPNSKM
jgi:hypothetical protein